MHSGEAERRNQRLCLSDVKTQTEWWLVNTEKRLRKTTLNKQILDRFWRRIGLLEQGERQTSLFKQGPDIVSAV